MTRFNPSAKLAEVRTMDGVTAVIAYSFAEDTWEYRIGGIPQDDLFDNLFYADGIPENLQSPDSRRLFS